MHVALLHTRIRLEEKMLLDAFERRGVACELIALGELALHLDPDAVRSRFERFDVVLDRCLSHTRAATLISVLEGYGVRCVNRSAVIDVCGDKIRTHVALTRADVPVPDASVAFTPEAGVRAVEELGYPAVLKPPVGSWGRLMARLNDRDAAEAVLEHKATLGGPQHGPIYAQRYVDKGGRDLRAFVVGDDVICAIERRSDHWITNTARGASAAAFPVTRELRATSLAAAHAVGGGILAVDLFEDSSGRLLVCEVNSTMEFKNSVEPTGVDIPGRMVDALCELSASRAAEVQHAW